MKNMYQPNTHPYAYMKDPMANVPLGNVPVRKVTPYHHEMHADHHGDHLGDHQQNKGHPITSPWLTHITKHMLSQITTPS